jgi:hypothetical protein
VRVMKSDEKLSKLFNIPLLYPLLLIGRIDEIIIESLPEKYKGAVEHYITAKTELLKAITEVINIRIKELEELKGSLEEVKREKVKLE